MSMLRCGNTRLWAVMSPFGTEEGRYRTKEEALENVPSGEWVCGVKFVDGAHRVYTTFDLSAICMPCGLHLATPEELYERFGIPSYVVDATRPMWCNEFDVVDYSYGQWIAERRVNGNYYMGWNEFDPMRALYAMQAEYEGARS